MAKKTQRNQHKKQQRALHKRTQRKRRLARRSAAQQSAPESSRRLLSRARDMPLSGSWVQAGWQDHGQARAIVARTQPNDSIMFGGFVADFLCTGIRDASFAVNVDPDVFSSETLPRMYDGEPPVAISEELAHEIVWGSEEYATNLGFTPQGSFRDAQRILESADALPRSGVVQFGYQGRPVYIPRPGDSEIAFLTTLIDAVGIGNFYYMPVGEVSEDVAALLDMDLEGGPQSAGLWTPDAQQAGAGAGADSASGLWVPGQQPEPTGSPDDAEAAPIWTPGRS